MIKRFKWNVVYDDDGADSGSDREHPTDEEQSRSSSSEDEDAAQVTGGRATALQQLAANDEFVARWMTKQEEAGNPDAVFVVAPVRTTAPPLKSDADSASSASSEQKGPNASGKDGDDRGNSPLGTQKKAAAHGKERPATLDENAGNGLTKGKASEKRGVKTCTVCPDRLLLNDLDVESHLKSKAHLKALKRADALARLRRKAAEANSEDEDEREEKLARKKEKREQKRKEKRKEKKKKKELSLSAAEIERRKEKFAQKKARRLLRRAQGDDGDRVHGPNPPGDLQKAAGEHLPSAETGLAHDTAVDVGHAKTRIEPTKLKKHKKKRSHEPEEFEEKRKRQDAKTK
ncbi:hypothetical protein FVE85_3092 [Porphyridium purpureum]|uniref:Uncharacterized protein n=1 Tax=Porphyridium purpureum TaxID=35688 RepID=A0A5J4YTK6_PORPP|nr:hypothetical protein FVE85_3092 [Porphyridium purpureum]|eukprot:POR1080..scf227_4